MKNFTVPMIAISGILTFSLYATNTYAGGIYSNDFSTGSTANLTLPSYGSIVSLPTDSAGLASANQAKWLAINSNQPKTVDENVMLSLSGLTAGEKYNVAFNLFIGGSWDGSAGYYGPDEIKLSVANNASTQTLLDATFANGQQGINFGADSRQSYSDANPVAGTGLLYNRFEGADASFSLNQGGNYRSDYSIYSFGTGTGNPILSFTADSSTANLTFQRLGIPSGDSGDEYWALGNLNVASATSATAVPEPETYAMMLAGLGLLGLVSRKRLIQ